MPKTYRFINSHELSFFIIVLHFNWLLTVISLWDGGNMYLRNSIMNVSADNTVSLLRRGQQESHIFMFRNVFCVAAMLPWFEVTTNMSQYRLNNSLK
jgi:hypothetical protein